MASLWMVAAAAVGVRHPGVGRTMLHTTMRIASARAMSTTAARAKPVPCAPRAILRLARPTHSSMRTLSTTTPRRRAARASAGGSRGAVEAATELAKYDGPLGGTFTRLKLFSLSSLGLASVLTPVLLLAPGEISLAGRIGLCVTALATSGVSTALIAWIGTPYVNSMRLLSPSTASEDEQKPVVMELNTVSWRLKPQRTLVYEPTFLRPTSRPFAAWEISNTAPPLPLPLPNAQQTLVKKIAETFDVKSGTSLGSYSVTYSSSAQDANGNAVGSVEVHGKPTRYFNVHEELLDENWQVLG